MRESRAHSRLRAATESALDELAKLLVSAGVGFGEFAEAARGAFVRAVAAELDQAGERVTHSAIAAATGLTRQQVSDYSRATAVRETADKQLTRARRLVVAWRADPQLRGKPLWLRSEARHPHAQSFAEFVRRKGGDVPPRAMQRELVRARLAEVTRDGRIALRAHDPSTARRAADSLHSALPWLRAVSQPIAANGFVVPLHSSLRWARLGFADERALRRALKQAAVRGQKLLAGEKKPQQRSGALAGELMLGLAIFAHVYGDSSAAGSGPKADARRERRRRQRVRR
jgi:hypothetical protein